MTNVRSLIRDTSQRYRFVVISQGEPGLSKYLQEHELAVPAIMLPPTSAAFSDIWKAGTPQTIVVGSNGAVVKAWPGAYSGAVKAEVERYFGVRLASDVNTPL
jgi:hypothetical protein